MTSSCAGQNNGIIDLVFSGSDWIEAWTGWVGEDRDDGGQRRRD